MLSSLVIIGVVAGRKYGSMCVVARAAWAGLLGSFNVLWQNPRDSLYLPQVFCQTSKFQAISKISFLKHVQSEQSTPSTSPSERSSLPPVSETKYLNRSHASKVMAIGRPYLLNVFKNPAPGYDLT
jgi:hypothetical protein